MNNLKYLTPLLLFTALYQARSVSYRQVYGCYRFYIRSIATVTALLLLIAPDTVALDYKGVLPGIPFRVHGFFCQANGLAALIGTYFLLPRPAGVTRRITSGTIGDLAALLVFILTQSKTMFALVTLGQAVRLVYPIFARMQPLARLIAAAGLIVVAAPIIVARGEILEMLLGTTQVGSDVATLTGRTIIWERLLADWQLKPWWGCAPCNWAETAPTLSLGKFTPGHAHSQVVQTLWETGLFGLLGLAAHFAMMARSALQAPPRLQAGLAAAVCVFVARGYSEVCVRLTGMADIQVSLYITLFLLLACATLATARLGESIGGHFRRNSTCAGTHSGVRSHQRLGLANASRPTQLREP